MARDIPERLRDKKMLGKRTHQQMEDLRIAQVTGEIEKIPANRASSIPDEHFRREYLNYQIKEHNVGNYHVAMEARLFNSATGEKISKSRVQIFEPDVFKRLLDTNGFHGHVTFVLHDPTFKTETASIGERGKELSDLQKSSSAEGGGVGSGLPEGELNDDGTAKFPVSGPDDPNTVNVANLNEADARALYLQLTGKTPDGRWSLEKLKEKIAEIQGDVK